MLGILLKKQVTEAFRSFFYDAKKNRNRPKIQIILLFTLFALLMFGFLGGAFGVMAYYMCPPLIEADVGWLYFIVFSLFAIVFGAFGSVFNTYSGLYLSKDNDLLLSMPIPVKYIIISRLLNVYLLGLMYSGLIIFPAIVIYWVFAKITFANFIGGLALIFIISLIVLILSCSLGWVVARISLRLKNKSFFVVIISLLGFAFYYFLYFQANEVVEDLLENAATYGQNIKGSAYFLYMFGRIGEGDWLSLLIYLVGVLAVTALVFMILSFNFIKIATTVGASKKVVYKEKLNKQKPVFITVLNKEFKRFFSSALYMLNCGMGILFTIILGVVVIFFGKDVVASIEPHLLEFPGLFVAIICAFLFSLASMNDIAAPSISLEGKTIWIYQSLPIKPKIILHAKAMVQIILTTIPMLVAIIPIVVVINTSILNKILIGVIALIYVVFSSYSSLFLGLRFANLSWTNEMMPIKQGAAVTISIFGGWGLAIVFLGLYFLFSYFLGLNIAIYLIIFIVIFAALTILIIHYLNHRGSERFAQL